MSLFLRMGWDVLRGAKILRVRDGERDGTVERVNILIFLLIHGYSVSSDLFYLFSSFRWNVEYDVNDTIDYVFANSPSCYHDCLKNETLCSGKYRKDGMGNDTIACLIGIYKYEYKETRFE